MAPIKTQWTRLIRFVAVETAQVHLGEPVDPTLDVGLAFARQEPVQAYEILGGVLDPTAQVTRTVLTVKALLAPLGREDVGGLVRCLGLNYTDYAIATKAETPAFPVLFFKPAATLTGPGAPVVIPKAVQPPSQHLPDYEVELVIVIGKTAKDVSEADALDYVLGYTGANDISFRWHQLAVSQWGFSKSFDNTNPLGPVLVAAGAIRDPQRLPLRCAVNGEVLQDGTTANQIFNVRQTIAHLSQGTTLQAGSIILTGTPKGVGFARAPQVFLKHGDRVAVTVGGGIGTLVNDVVEEGAVERAKL